MKARMTYTYEEIRSWPAAVDLVRAAQVFGIGRTSAYEMAQAGTFPARVVRVDGRGRWVVATESILAVLGAKEQPCAS
jgi:predicted DNA-binding transcriptional regulator AlpA